MSMTFGSRNRQTADMNVTPLIDVLLVLIIIFMVVIPNHSRGEQADIPQAAPTDSHVLPPDTSIVVQLRDEGEGKRPTLRINETRIAWEELVPKMRELLVPRADRVAFLKSDDSVEFEYVAQAVDLTRAAGAERVGLMTRAETVK